MATHSSILAREISWTKEPGRVAKSQSPQSTVHGVAKSQRHDVMTQQQVGLESNKFKKKKSNKFNIAYFLMFNNCL